MHPVCTYTILLKKSILVVSGLCFGSKFDAHFGWTGRFAENSNLYTFSGYSKSHISWDKKKKEWRMAMYNDPKSYATCNETDGMYPFGIYNWYFFNDSCPRAGPSEIVADNIIRIPISFSACRRNEFTCKDGTWYLLSST